jgi:hypothetical protein
VVDPYARADFFLAFGPEGVDVEEAFVTFPTVPGGLLLKVGKMRTAFGKVDGMHNHVLPWTDRPLVTKNLVGGEEGLSDSGISISRLFPNSFVFLEATGQVYRGASEVFQAPTRADLTYVGHLRAYRDLTENTNLDLGGSIAYGHNDSGPDQTTRLFGVDAAFRFRALRRAIYQRLILRSSSSGAGAVSQQARRGPPTPERARRHGRVWHRNAGLRGPRYRSPGAGTRAGDSTGPSAPTMRACATRAARCSHLVAERVQPDPRPIPVHPLR